MKNPSVENYQQNAPQTKQNPQAKEVFVRVLKNLGNNRYIVSFLGERTELRSKIPLQVGESFKARGFVQNGKPYFEIIDSKAVLEEITGDAKLLQSLGLANDSLSHLMIAFFKSFGIKINTEYLQKARFLAEAFGENKEKAAEIALFLLDKGLEPDIELISSFLSMFLLKNTDEKTENLFTATNHIQTSADHWLILPLEKEKAQNESGLLKILINKDLQITKKISISYIKNGQKIFFMLDYLYNKSHNKPKCVEFCFEPALDIKKQKAFQKELEVILGSFGNLAIAYRQSLFEESIFSFGEKIQEFKGWA